MLQQVSYANILNSIQKFVFSIFKVECSNAFIFLAFTTDCFGNLHDQTKVDQFFLSLAFPPYLKTCSNTSSHF